VIRQLRVDELNESVTSAGLRDECRGIFEPLFLFSELPADKGAFWLARCGRQAQNRDAIFGTATHNRPEGSVRQNQLIESNDRDVK
jgi:hypothetical protein